MGRCRLTRMQITDNTTEMEAGISVSTNKEGYDFCVLAIKGTFSIEKDGNLILSDEQTPLVYAEEPYSDPGSTPIEYECDFAPYKLCTDILVNGHACCDTGKLISETAVCFSREFLSVTNTQ